MERIDGNGLDIGGFCYAERTIFKILGNLLGMMSLGK